jgi:hypothetical protein
MDEEEVPATRAAGVLLVVAVPTVGFWIGALTDGPGSTLAFGAVLAPLLAIAGLGLFLGRKVGSSPDEPDVVPDRLAEAVGGSNEELEDRFE